jgi:hypothetical protein
MQLTLQGEKRLGNALMQNGTPFPDFDLCGRYPLSSDETRASVVQIVPQITLVLVIVREPETVGS